MKLTKTLVETAAPKEKKYLLTDSLVPGLRVLVLPSGAKTYYVRMRTAEGRQIDFKLGTPVELTPDDARRLARDALAKAREGKDPARERQQLRQSATIADLATQYKVKHGDRKPSGANDEILWRRHIVPALGTLKVATITRDQIRDFHFEHPKPFTANRCLEVLSIALSLAEEWGLRAQGTNPARGIKAHPEPKRERYLRPDELERLRAALDRWEVEWGTIRWRFAHMIRLLLLTGARLRNIMNARFEWVDPYRKMIIVPMANHKTGRKTQKPLQIHLGDRGMKLVEELRRASNSEWLIQGDIDGPLVGYRKPWLALLKDAEIANFRVHDLRHSFASYMIDTGESLKAVGTLLGHQSPQTTDRYAHLLDDGAQRAVSKVSERLGI